VRKRISSSAALVVVLLMMGRSAVAQIPVDFDLGLPGGAFNSGIPFNQHI
jgi:hypothetical protein